MGVLGGGGIEDGVLVLSATTADKNTSVIKASILTDFPIFILSRFLFPTKYKLRYLRLSSKIFWDTDFGVLKLSCLE